MSSTDARTENDAVIEAARAGGKPSELVPGRIYSVVTANGDVRQIDLSGDEYLAPRRKEGTVVVHDVASFAAYFAKHRDTATEVYADLDLGIITAVLDAHQAEAPRWEEHLLKLQLTQTMQWQRWLQKDRQPLPQVQFAEHLEDNLVDIDRNPVDAATMLQVASTFQAATKGTFSSKANLSTGARSLIYEEESTATSGGGKQTIPVPEKFAILVAPFDDVDLYRIEARFRYRIENNALKLFYVLDRPEDSLRDAVKQIVDQVKDATGATIMRGSPA